MRKFITLFLLLPAALHLCGQSFKFRKYAEQDGLNNRFIYTLDQDEWGNLMIGTGEGLYSYDGFSFSEISGGQGLSDNFLTCSATGKNGSVWYGHNKGIVTKYQNHQFEHFDISTYTESRINSIAEDNNGILWVLTQNDGLLQKSADGKWLQYKKGLEEFTLYSFVIDHLNNIWLGTDMGLLKARITGTETIEYTWIEEITETKVSCLTHAGNVIYAGTEDAGIFQIAPNANEALITPVKHRGETLKDLSVNYIFIDNSGSLWICTNNKGLIQLTQPIEIDFYKLTKYRDKQQLKTSSVKICKADREGTIWVGTMGDGLLKLTDDYFSIHSFREDKEDNQIYSIFEKNDSVWYGSNGKVYLSIEEPTNIIDSIDVKKGLNNYPVTAIHRDKMNNIWIGNNMGELYILKPGQKKLSPIKIGTELQQQQINDIQGYQEK